MSEHGETWLVSAIYRRPSWAATDALGSLVAHYTATSADDAIGEAFDAIKSQGGEPLQGFAFGPAVAQRIEAS